MTARVTREPTGRALGYVRVSTRRQDLSPQAQAERLEHRAAERGLELTLVEERVSGSSLAARRELRRALQRLAAGEFDALLTDKMDRVARNLRDFLALDDQAQREGWALVVLNLDFDSSTATGRLIRTVMAAIAEWERRMIGERTAEALAAKRTREPGWHPGRPRLLSDDVRAQVLALRHGGLTLRACADTLNAAHVPTATGGEWRPGTVASVLRTAKLSKGTAGTQREETTP